MVQMELIMNQATMRETRCNGNITIGHALEHH
jgi:hypothetical protein